MWTTLLGGLALLALVGLAVAWNDSRRFAVEAEQRRIAEEAREAQLTQLTRDAEGGNAEAQYELARSYGVKGNDSEASRWYQAAAKQGHRQAESLLSITSRRLKTRRETLKGVRVATDRMRLSASDFGDEWPLTVDSGDVACVGGRFVIFVAADGRTYAINGAARARGKWADIAESAIWRDNPRIQIEGAKVSIGPILDTGVALCKGVP
jgi:hypothetical protein